MQRTSGYTCPARSHRSYSDCEAREIAEAVLAHRRNDRSNRSYGLLSERIVRLLESDDLAARHQALRRLYRFEDLLAATGRPVGIESTVEWREAQLVLSHPEFSNLPPSVAGNLKSGNLDRIRNGLSYLIDEQQKRPRSKRDMPEPPNSDLLGLTPIQQLNAAAWYLNDAETASVRDRLGPNLVDDLTAAFRSKRQADLARLLLEFEAGYTSICKERDAAALAEESAQAFLAALSELRLQADCLAEWIVENAPTLPPQLAKRLMGQDGTGYDDDCYFTQIELAYDDPFELSRVITACDNLIRSNTSWRRY
jgi:hypothetical protein